MKVADDFLCKNIDTLPTPKTASASLYTACVLLAYEILIIACWSDIFDA